MRPRRVRLGYVERLMPSPYTLTGFNEAEARAPRIPRHDMAALRVETGASMRPRRVRLGYLRFDQRRVLDYGMLQ